MTDIGHEQVDHLMVYRRPDEATQATMERIRAAFMTLGHEIVDQVLPGSLRSRAVRSLHQALMETMAALAIDGAKKDDDRS